ncbi:unnamed protein product [Heligmosomoides polygyrus]|uniref:CCHC-type domain-containing protein n=1 Tax=Heligmosomoides polygyrus TaxID=6339 RepID=A0A183GAG2_HELPZ|nr:unnamed protein product [Heligmosomoides polygyrus]
MPIVKGVADCRRDACERDQERLPPALLAAPSPVNSRTYRGPSTCRPQSIPSSVHSRLTASNVELLDAFRDNGNVMGPAPRPRDRDEDIGCFCLERTKQEPGPTTTGSIDSPIQCFNCGGTGHYSRAAFEGAPEAVTITSGVCSFPIADVANDEIMLAHSRTNVLCDVHFSESPASIVALRALWNLVKDFLPYHSEEAWRALAVLKNAEDDRDSHWLHGQIPNLRAFPLQILMTIPDMPLEAGWTKGRPVIAWIDVAPSLTHLKVHKVTALPVQRELVVILDAYHWSHAAVIRAVENHGCRVGTNVFVDLYVKLDKPPVCVRHHLAAVTQFAETVKSIAEFANVPLIRYVSDSAAAEERVPLPVDLNEVLKNLGETYETRLTSDQLKACRKFREGRIRYEYYAAREDGLLEIPEDARSTCSPNGTSPRPYQGNGQYFIRGQPP